MNLKSTAALALLAMASASPAFASPSMRPHEHRSGHRAMLLAHAATTPSMRHDAAPKMQQQDDWPANLILGRLELRSAPARTPIAV